MKKLIFVFIAVLVIGFISCNKDDVTPIEFTTNPTPKDEAFVKTIEFPSGDSLMITADHFHVNNSKPIIVLCHQAFVLVSLLTPFTEPPDLWSIAKQLNPSLFNESAISRYSLLL
jgi:hypothetical protein